MFDKGEFIPSSNTAADDEGFIDGNKTREENEVVNDQKETVFQEEKPLLMVNVENVLDEKFNQDQELKVSKPELIRCKQY